MKLNDECPIKDGWYWCARKVGDLRPWIVRVYQHYKGYIAISEHPMDERDVKTLDYLWAGPLLEPERLVVPNDR